ncbi:DUF502 domain-containing protein [Mariniflexile aquimaris]|uniref:DUF502 domain-containing protein n=1 Tax=Mariniflexile aquimaris TaxID=881009 RepID=A0ABW3BVU6_9FLAO
MKRLMNYLLHGILYIAPLAITIYIIYSIFTLIDETLQKVLIKIFDFNIPGLGFVTLILFLILVGFLGKSFIARPFNLFIQKTLERVPLLNLLYSAINDLFSAFVGKEKKFNQPVLVKVNLISNLEKLGFITEENLELLNEKDKVAVYFPHSYNFSGELFIVPKEHIKAIDLSSTDVMKFIVSAGVSGWEKTPT